MKTFNLLIMVTLICHLEVTAQPKTTVTQFNLLLKSHDYKTLLTEAASYRKKIYGRTPVVDYFIAASLCGMGEFANASRMFEYILRNYSLNDNQVTWIKQQKQNCQPTEDLSNYDRELIALVSASFSSVGGKMGYLPDCHSGRPQYSFDSNAEKLDFSKRLYFLNEGEKATKYYTTMLGSAFLVTTSGRFVIITPKNRHNSIPEISQNLEKVFQFFVTRYSLRKPEHLITVFLTRDSNQLSEIALKVHGLVLYVKNIGYSHFADLSVLGNGAEDKLGTIYHELLHLLVRTDIGDIPGWLDEGLACLYSETDWRGPLLVGSQYPWRTRVLRDYIETKGDLPKLRQIIKNNWGEYRQNETRDMCDLAVNYAVANHFAIWLQEKDFLNKVVRAFKERNIFTTANITTQTVDSYVTLENALGRPLDEIERQFESWMLAKYSIRFRE